MLNMYDFSLYEGLHLYACVQGKKVVPCRFDWHQTGSQVIISIYAKNSVPELSLVEGNSTVVRQQGQRFCVICNVIK